MKNSILGGSGLLLVAGIVGGVVLWHNSSVPMMNGHVLGENVASFVKIEAKLHKIDLDKCDDIGRPEKRQLCDDFVELLAGRGTVLIGNPQDNLRVINSSGGQFTFAGRAGTDGKLKDGRLVQFLVGDS